ncbi:MAG: helix-turn-helix transcriptional regulator [Bacteroidetes bacterium]|nr:helix-turn-helix transcriptional regulator [Bacteroidota bacterium]
MDNFYITSLLERKAFSAHTGAFNRQFSVLPALDAVGYLPEKTNWINMEFLSWNFSIILSGNGTYYADGKEYQVIPPCVLTQQPGIHMHYGPDSSWEELFLIYDKEAANTLIRGNVFPGKQDSPVWRFNNSGKTTANMRLLAESLDLLQYQQYAGNVDLSAYETIISTISSPYRENWSRSSSDDFTKILAVEDHLRFNPAISFDIERTAAENSMHPAKFRRLWNILFDEPPNRHLQKLRLMQSAKLLAETKMQIQEVADITGFQDSLYFSRLFKREYGVSPKYYREKYAESLIANLSG